MGVLIFIGGMLLGAPLGALIMGLLIANNDDEF